MYDDRSKLTLPQSFLWVWWKEGKAGRYKGKEGREQGREARLREGGKRGWGAEIAKPIHSHIIWLADSIPTWVLGVVVLALHCIALQAGRQAGRVLACYLFLFDWDDGIATATTL